MLKYRSVVTRKGQVTIPKDVRDSLGIVEGDKVEWIRDGDKVSLTRSGSVVDRTFGALKQYAIRPFTSYEDEERALEDAMTEDWLESEKRSR